MDVIFCEGCLDRLFIPSTMAQKLSVASGDIGTCREVKEFQRKVQSGRFTQFTVSEGGGRPNCLKVAVSIVPQLYWQGTPWSVGVIADSDKGPVYEELVDRMGESLMSRYGSTNLSPQLERFDSNQRLTVSLRRGKAVTLWAQEVPENLERRVAEALTQGVQPSNPVENDDDIIRNACNKKQCSKKEIIEECVGSLFTDKQWFQFFCQKLKGNLHL